MKHNYKVHRASWHPRETDVTLVSGETVKASVQSLEIELVPDDHDGGSVTFRLVGHDAADAAKQYHVGAVVEISLAPMDNVADAPHEDDHEDEVK